MKFLFPQRIILNIFTLVSYMWISLYLTYLTSVKLFVSPSSFTSFAPMSIKIVNIFSLCTFKKKINKLYGFDEKISWTLKIYWKSNFVLEFHKKIHRFTKFKKNFKKIKNSLGFQKTLARSV